MDADVEEMDSDLEKGKVAWQSIDAGEMVSKGTRIQVRLSSGKAPARAVTLNIPLPNRPGEEGLLRIYVDLLKVKEESVLLNGEYPVRVEGSGAQAAVEATLDNTRLYTATVDFSADPPVVSNERSHIDLPTVPDVTGMTEQQARDELRLAGYNSVEVYTRRNLSPFARSGVVGSQTPGGNSQADYNAQVIIYINE
jgi:beta-lactam-binding protein with PASTA domain